MKKIIISMLTLVIGVTLFSATAFADASLNSPGAMPTISVTNGTTNPCSFGTIDGCWKTSASAKPGDVIAVHIYYKNTSNETAHNVTLGLQPSRNGTLVTFNGGVKASNAPAALGTATVTLSQTTTITTLLGDQRPEWHPSVSSGPQEVNVSALTSSGFNIGDVAAGGQGVLVARFRVDGTVTPPGNTCVINNFSASPTTIALGNSSTLTWNTSNCDYVSVTTLGSNLQTDDSKPVSPTNTTTYTLTAYPGGKTATATVTVTNNGGGNSCTINSFNANPSSINRGDSSVLNWNTTNCSYVTINPSANGNLPADGQGSVTPSNTTTYTLTAYPGAVTTTTTVNVYGNNNNYCSINTFYVDSNSISQGQSTTLHWNTTGANYVYITGFGQQSANGSVSISPYSSTTYILSLNGNNCNGNTSQSIYVTVGQSNNNNVQQPQAITTVASVLSSYSAQLNGIAVPNNTYGSSSAWFEYGNSTSLGNRSDSQSVNGFGTYPYNANISGLAPGGTYYYRAVVQNQVGIAYGSIVPFNTPGATTYTPPTKVVYVQSQTTTRSTNTGLVAKSQPSLFKLEVDSNIDHMCVNGFVDYTVNYQNISTQDLQNSVLRITFPGELTYVSGSQGSYDVTDRTLTIALGDVQPGQQGSVTVHAEVNSQAAVGKLAVITATIVYTNPTSHAQENAIAYSLITVSNDCPSVLGASVFGFGGFLPTTLLGWLLLILIILALIVLARSLYRRKDEPVRTA